ncbi:MAG TPA: hypothetical protein VFK88_11455 [Gallionella sp.]|nr:hypothetical protein [Gallionella sp.]
MLLRCFRFFHRLPCDFLHLFVITIEALDRKGARNGTTRNGLADTGSHAMVVVELSPSQVDKPYAIPDDLSGMDKTSGRPTVVSRQPLVMVRTVA